MRLGSTGLMLGGGSIIDEGSLCVCVCALWAWVHEGSFGVLEECVVGGG